MRLGRVVIPGYVVDLDDENMIYYAKEAMLEDLYSAIKYNELPSWITLEIEPPTLNEGDIPEFLKEEEYE
jgi:hypothetical protein